MKKIIQFIICLLIPLAVGGLSGFATSKNIESWHQYLTKPWFNPPNYLFGPVWTSLFYNRKQNGKRTKKQGYHCLFYSTDAEFHVEFYLFSIPPNWLSLY